MDFEPNTILNFVLNNIKCKPNRRSQKKTQIFANILLHVDNTLCFLVREVFMVKYRKKVSPIYEMGSAC